MFSAVGSSRGFHAITRKLPVDGSPSPSIPMSIGRLGHLRYRRKLHTKRPNCSPSPLVASDGGAEQEGAILEEEEWGEESKLSTNARLKRKYRLETWEAARAFKESGEILTVHAFAFNNGGLLVRFQSLIGFLPYTQLSVIYHHKEPEKSVQDIAKSLVGSSFLVKVLVADEAANNLTFSEKDALWLKYSSQINDGDVFEGKVTSVEDYGAFVALNFPDGEYHLSGLVHVSEVSWDFIQDVRDVLNVGDSVKVKIKGIDREKARIMLSIKQLDEDPLLESIDKVILQEGQVESNMEGVSSNSKMEPLPGLESICNELLQEEGITSVKLGRQGLEKRVVSQDLEIWLSTAPAKDNQFSLLARAGRQVQEVHVMTNLDPDGVKQAVRRVLGRIP